MVIYIPPPCAFSPISSSMAIGRVRHALEIGRLDGGKPPQSCTSVAFEEGSWLQGKICAMLAKWILFGDE